MNSTFRVLILVLLCTVYSIQEVKSQDFKNEKQLVKGANDAFDKEDYNTASPLFSTLVSNYPKDPEYNWKYGACLIYSDGDKSKSLKYLGFAVSKPDVDPLAYYYYAVALHLNYEFRKALGYYNKFLNKGKASDIKKYEVENKKQQATNGTQLLQTITDLVVLDKKELRDEDFYKVYDLSDFGGQILVKPDDFQSDYEKKNNVKGIFYFPKDADKIFFSRQNSEDGSKDIYYKVRNPDGTWSKAISMGKPINTPYDEDYPFLHPNGDVLYFASKGHNSLGGYDIFVSRIDAQGNWTKPQNMDFAINTPADDYLLITDASGQTAYFTSDRETSEGQVSVYQINMERVPLDFAFVYGTFSSDATKKAKIKVVDAVSNELVGNYETDDDGKYKIKLPNQGKFNFIVDYENSKVAHSGTVEIPNRNTFKPIKQTMEVVDQGTPNEKLVIKNLMDEDVDEPVQLTPEFLKAKAKLKVNKDKYKDKKTDPKLISAESHEKESDSDTQSSSESYTAGNSGRVDAEAAGKAGTSIASEKTVNQNINTTGPELVAAENRANESTVPLTVQSDNPSKEEISEVAANQKTALSNDEKIYNRQAEIARKKSSEQKGMAQQKRNKANELLAVAGGSKESEEYQQAQVLLLQAELLEQKSKTSDEITRNMEQNAQQTQDMSRVADTYSSQIENQSDLSANQQSYKELEGKVNSGVDRRTELLELQKNYNKTYNQKQQEAQNQRAKTEAMHEELNEIREDIKRNESQLASAKGKEKAQLEEEIARDKADLEAEQSTIASEEQKTAKLNKEAAMAKMNLDAVNEIISATQTDSELNELDNEVSFTQVPDNEEIQAAYFSDNDLSELSEQLASVGGSGAAGTSLNSKNSSRDVNTEQSELAENNASSGVSGENEGDKTDGNIASNELGENNQTSDDASGFESSTDSDGMETKTSTTTVADNSQGNGNSDQSNNSGAGNSNAVGTTSTNIVGGAFVLTPSAKTIENAVSESSGTFKEEEIDAFEAMEISSDAELSEPELALMIDSSDEKVSGFSPEETLNELTNADQSLRSISQSGYNKRYLDEFLSLVEDEGTDQEKAVKTYAINESWLLDVNKELEYLYAIEDEVPDEYQQNLQERILSLESMRNTRLDNLESSKSRALELSAGISSSQLETQSDDARKQINERVNPALMAQMAQEGSDDQSMQEEGSSDQLALAQNNSSSSQSENSSEGFNNGLQANNATQPDSESQSGTNNQKTDNGERFDGSTSQSGSKTANNNSQTGSDVGLEANNTSGNQDQSGENGQEPNNSGNNSSNSNFNNSSEGNNEVASNSNTSVIADNSANTGDRSEGSSTGNSSVNAGGEKSETSGQDGDGRQSDGSSADQTNNSELEKFATSEGRTDEDGYHDFGEEEDAQHTEKVGNTLFVDATAADSESTNSADNSNSGTSNSSQGNNQQENSGNAQSGNAQSGSTNNSAVSMDRSDRDQTSDASISSNNSGNNSNQSENNSENYSSENTSDDEDQSRNNSANLNSSSSGDIAVEESTSDAESSGTNSGRDSGLIQGNSNSNSGKSGNQFSNGNQNSNSVQGIPPGGFVPAEDKTTRVAGETSDRLGSVLGSSEQSTEQVLEEKTAEILEQQVMINAEVDELETSLNANRSKMESAKRKERKELAPQIEQQEKALADVNTQKEIIEHREEAIERAAETIVNLPEGAEKESEKELKRAEVLKVEAEEKFSEADTKEGEKVRGKKKKRARAKEVQNLRDDGERILLKAAASESLVKELETVEAEVLDAYKNTPEEMPVSRKKLSNAEVANVRNSAEFKTYDSLRVEAKKQYKMAEVAYVEAEKLDNENKNIRAQITQLSAQVDAETDISKINSMQEEIAQMEEKVDLNDKNSAQLKEQAKDYYTQYNHLNNEAVRLVKNAEPSKKANLLAYANQLENEGAYWVAPIPGSSLANKDGQLAEKGYSPDAFTRVVQGIDDYPDELKGAIFDMIDFNKSLYNEENPIPVDTKLPGGVVFKVQIGAFRTPPPQDVFKGFAPVRGENTRPGWVRYTAGLFNSIEQARLKRNEIRALGYKDAFVVAYKDGKRIGLSEAKELVAQGYSASGGGGASENLAQNNGNGSISGFNNTSGNNGGVGSNSSASGFTGEVLKLSEIKGLMYTVQVGAFKTQITSNELFGISPLVEYQQSGLYKYGSGVYNDRAKAAQAKEAIVAAGVSDAFVTAFYNGKRVSMSEAASIAQQGPEVFAPEAPVNISTTSPGDIVFRVQVGAYRQEVPVEDAKIILTLSNLGIDVQQVDGLTTYTVGRYASYEEAQQVNDRVKAQGLSGAFVVAYEKGNRIELQEAIRKLGR